MNPKQPNQFNPKDIFLILKRRKIAFLIPFGIIFLFCLILALMLPAYYKSSATILIEEQEIPQDYVMATVSSYAEQRLEIIKQRIMSYSKLLELINQFDLYAELKDKWTTEEIVRKMREEIQVNTLSAEVMDRRSGRPTAVTIAFTLMYQGKEAKKVHQVTSELTSLFLEENLKVRTRQTKEAIQFFEDELKRVKQDLNTLNSTISAFKEKNLLKLPEYTEINMQLLQSTDKTIENHNEQLKTLAERENYYVTQLSLISPEVEFNSDQRRLEELKVQLVSLKSKFSDVYPDVVNTKAEIEKLTSKLEDNNKTPQKQKRKPDNPTYINISSQLAGIKAEIESVGRQIENSKIKKSNYESRIESAANIEGDYRNLMSDQTNMTSKMNDLTQKLMEAKVAHGLEAEQKGERFTLIDPARLPEEPFKPNRVLILIIGFILSCALGMGCVALFELLSDTLHTVSDITEISTAPVLGEIPVILTQKDNNRSTIRKRIIILSAVLTPGFGLALFHFFIMDLYVFWAKLMRIVVL